MILIIKLGILEILGFLSAFLVGISLGLLGSGGSVLAMPILTYLFKFNEKVATAYSLFVVGASALLASYFWTSLIISSIWFFVFLTSIIGSSSPVGLNICSVIIPSHFDSSYSEGVALT